VADRSQTTARRTDRDRVLELVGGLAGVHVRTERPALVRIAVWQRWARVHLRTGQPGAYRMIRAKEARLRYLGSCYARFLFLSLECCWKLCASSKSRPLPNSSSILRCSAPVIRASGAPGSQANQSAGNSRPRMISRWPKWPRWPPVSAPQVRWFEKKVIAAH
jgi:hypothetical protein